MHLRSSTLCIRKANAPLQFTLASFASFLGAADVQLPDSADPVTSSDHDQSRLPTHDMKHFSRANIVDWPNFYLD